jgi:ParB family chromosome partitioning protein
VVKLKKDYNFFDVSNQAAEAEQELTAAQVRISELEKLNQQLETLVGAQVSSKAKTEATLPVSVIVRDYNQVRRWFDPEKQARLTASIKEVGIRERLWVRPLPDGQYQLIAGERRFRAALDARLAEVPVEILEIDDELALTLSLLENLQREDLNPVEEAEGILRLLAKRIDGTVESATSLLYKMKNHQQGLVSGNVSPNEKFQVVESVFSTVGRISWLSFVRTRLPLLKLPEDVLEVLRQGQIEYTKAIAIAGVKEETVRQALLRETIELNLSLSSIKTRIKTLRPNKPSASLKDEFKQVLSIRSRSWDDPKKTKKIKALLGQLHALISE